MWVLITVSMTIVVGYRWTYSSEKPDMKLLSPKEGELIVKVTANGTVKPRNKIVVNSPIAGRVDRVLVEEGAKVRKGQPLAILSSSDRVALMDSLNQVSDLVERKRLQDMYRPMSILAPAAGTVVLRNVNHGQSVTQENTLFEISDMLIVISKVDETDIAKVKVGQEVEITIDAYSSLRFSGQVERIGQQSTITNNVTTYDVFITPVQAFTENIKSGMSTSIDYLISRKGRALLIPTWLSEGRKNTQIEVQISVRDQKPETRQITLGESNGDSVEVLAGLSVTDQILYKQLTYETEAKGVPFGAMGGKKKQ